LISERQLAKRCGASREGFGPANQPLTGNGGEDDVACKGQQ
jgi:hypothetical protein